jgi:type VI secretion system protein ImpA
MKRTIDLDAILAPIPGDSPAGEDLRYTPVYEEIKEARRADDELNLGDWQRETKRADWDKAIKVCVEALTGRTKDLQIAAWLTEALAKTEGFEGFATGLKIINAFMGDYWENVYPVIEDGDLDFRAAPIEFLNEKLWVCVKNAPLTDPRVTPGYSWFKWQESREVGLEADAQDDSRRQAREEKIAEGKLSAEEFDTAVEKSKKAYYESVFADVTECVEQFKQLDATVDEKFGAEAPRLAELRTAVEDCERLAAKILKAKREKEPDPAREPEPEPESEPQQTGGYLSRLFKRQREPAADSGAEASSGPSANTALNPGLEAFQIPAAGTPAAIPPLAVYSYADSGSIEAARWETALKALETSGIKSALEMLFAAASSAPSIRERNRYRLLMAKICLKAGRPDLARPIVEELRALLEELHLERWESPTWIAEVLDALYQCLTKGEPSDDDLAQARDLFQRLCTTDVTKAMFYRL